MRTTIYIAPSDEHIVEDARISMGLDEANASQVIVEALRLACSPKGQRAWWELQRSRAEEALDRAQRALLATGGD